MTTVRAVGEAAIGLVGSRPVFLRDRYAGEQRTGGAVARRIRHVA